jgi:MFS family permease
MSLVLAYSSDIAEDIGYMESAAGLSFVVGPAVGGVLYASCGLQNTFLVLGACYVVCLAFVPYITLGSKLNISAASRASDHLIKEEEEESYKILSNSGSNVNSSGHTTTTKMNHDVYPDIILDKLLTDEEVNIHVHLHSATPQHGSSEEVSSYSPWPILAKEPTVWIASTVGVIVWMTTGFYDVYLSSELKQTLDIGARGRGLIYVWPALTYAIFSLFLGAICRKIGPRNVLLFGCVGHIVVTLAYGPNVYLVEMADKFGWLDKNHGRDFEWYCISFSMGLWGFFLAPLFQGTMPLMHGALAAKGHLKIPPSAAETAETEAASLGNNNNDNKNDNQSEGRQGSGGSGDLIQVMADRRAAIIKEKLEDSLSALQQTTSACGQILGPLLGGLALEYLPKRKDPGCNPDEVSNETDDDSTASIDCATGFAWATTIIAGLFFILSCLIMTLPNYKSVEEFEGEVLSMEVLTVSPIMRRRNSHASDSSNHGT